MGGRLRFVSPNAGTIMLAVLMAVATAGCTRSEEKAMQEGAIAEQQLNDGQIAAARVSIRRAVTERDDIPELQLLRGRIAMTAGDTNDAFSAYGIALALDNSNVEALHGVAQLGLQTNNFQDAESAATRLLTLNPRDRIGLFVRGLIELLRSQNQQAIQTAQALLTVDPLGESGTMLLARALVVNGDTDGALAAIRQTAAIKGLSPNLSLLLLEIARVKGDAAAMREQFARLRRARPKDIELRLDEADLLYKTAEVARARIVLRDLLRAPTLELGNARDVVALLAEHDPNPFAEMALAEIARTANLTARRALAHFYLDSGRPQQAAIAIGPDRSASAEALRARVAAALGRDSLAEAMASRILADDKSQCDALLARGEALIHRRQNDSAILAIQAAQAQCPQFLGGWLLLARAYDAKRDPIGVARAFEQGIDADPLQSLVPRRYTAWLLARGDGSRALGVARRLAGDAPALLSGWKLYRDSCSLMRDEHCIKEAEAGLDRAKTLFGMDVPAGEIPSRGFLFARLKRS